ncbi:uncharacterized protein CDV56_105658 [Aspergillus thermomutatus]|uniref:Uncharacterized protein n=1 Tax=Aspergillus thermomutatus TaxID=41047 RepID=A0A397GTK6_ASPTH|nr:uncharacterized protein CDV56_105658 [Aspergillus thermomutatus]RHZ52998.1 hypothetical protein CDV56_105658 [Aspergillus thermomutatus]
MSENSKKNNTPQASGRRRSSVVPPSLQFLVDQDPQQDRDGPAQWEKSWDQTTNNRELSDFLERVSSRNLLDSTRYTGGKIRKGS